MSVKLAMFTMRAWPTWGRSRFAWHQRFKLRE